MSRRRLLLDSASPAHTNDLTPKTPLRMRLVSWFLLLLTAVQAKLTYHKVSTRHRSYNRNCFFTPASCLLYKPEDSLRSMAKVIERDYSPKKYRSVPGEEKMLVAWLSSR